MFCAFSVQCKSLRIVSRKAALDPSSGLCTPVNIFSCQWKNRRLRRIPLFPSSLRCLKMLFQEDKTVACFYLFLFRLVS